MLLLHFDDLFSVSQVYKPLFSMILLTMYKTSRTMITIAMPAITARAIVADLYASFETTVLTVEELCAKNKQMKLKRSVLQLSRFAR